VTRLSRGFLAELAGLSSPTGTGTVQLQVLPSVIHLHILALGLNLSHVVSPSPAIENTADNINNNSNSNSFNTNNSCVRRRAPVTFVDTPFTKCDLSSECDISLCATNTSGYAKPKDGTS
jgi:hypothetical protein